MSKIAYIRHLPRMVAGGVITLLLVGVCVFAVVQSPTRDRKIALGVIAVLAAVVLVRIGRSGVVVTEDGLVIRNWWRSHTVPWRQIVGFSSADEDHQHRTVGLNLVGDRRLSCPALQTLGGFRWLPPAPPVQPGAPRRSTRYDNLRAQHGTDAVTHRAADQLADYVDRARRAGKLGHATDPAVG